jgi:lipoprotein-anchoring transpeptidase ErfK/SrfK
VLGRKLSVVIVTALFSTVMFLAISWPRTLAPKDVSVPAGKSSADYLSTVPALPGQPPGNQATATAEPAPAAGPPVTAVLPRGSGRQLRIGFAGPASSPATVADAIVSKVGLYSEPGQAEPDDWLDNPTWEGLPGTFLVHGRQGDWLNVQVSMRPNQATAWIKASEVSLRQTPYRVLIDLGARTLTAYNGSSVILSASVAPGTDDTPTPTGDFFVDGIVRPPDPSGPYGAFQVSVAAFSNVHYSFGGGNGQIAIHGTNRPELIGSPASNGCVRMTNEDVTALASAVPLGTPVRIV